MGHYYRYYEDDIGGFSEPSIYHEDDRHSEEFRKYIINGIGGFVRESYGTLYVFFCGYSDSDQTWTITSTGYAIYFGVVGTVIITADGMIEWIRKNCPNHLNWLLWHPELFEGRFEP